VLILQRPWTEQPQDGAGLDYGCGIVSGLGFVLNGASPAIATTGQVVTRSGVSTSFGLAGVATKNAADTGFTAATHAFADNPSQWTGIAVINGTALATNVGLISFADSAGRRYELRASAAGVYAVTHNSTYQQSSSAPALKTVNVIIGGYDGTSYRLYINGEAITMGAGGAIGAGAASTVRHGHLASSATSTFGYLGLIYLSGLWPGRWLSYAELDALAQNPWQLFAPRRIFIPYAAAAGGLPTLSAATYVPGSLTSTGFRPRVTATY
jgi:hypothetical protein